MDSIRESEKKKKKQQYLGMQSMGFGMERDRDSLLQEECVQTEMGVKRGLWSWSDEEDWVWVGALKGIGIWRADRSVLVYGTSELEAMPQVSGEWSQ